MSEHLFRKSALKQLNSPDQLDHLMQVLHWQGWTVLAACSLLILAALGWSLFGNLKINAQGRGMILSSEGVCAAECPGGGQVSHIDIQVGALVQKGQRLGLVTNPTLDQQILQAAADLEAAQQKEKKLREFYAEYIARSKANIDKNSENIRFRLSFLKEHKTFLQDRLEAYKRMKSGGVAREDEVQNVRVQLDETLNNLNECNFQLLNLENQLEVQRSEAEKAILDAEMIALSTTKRLDSLQKLKVEMTEIRAPVSGRVLEVCVDSGAVLNAGGPFAIIGRVTGEPEAVIFFKAEIGRKVKPGMKAFIYPSTVAKEEFGGITAEVVEVSDYLVSMEGLGRILNNQIMAQKIIEEQGALVSARIRLKRDEAGKLVWSSSGGPELTVDTGTVCETRVVVEQKHPLDMLIPHLLSALGME